MEAYCLFKFIHAADIHLDSPLAGLERYDDAPVSEIRGATRHAFSNLVRLAIVERVDFLLIAGDLYDGDWRCYRTGLHFVQQMRELREARIPVYIVAGNHDAANLMTRSLPLPANVHMLSATRPETQHIDSLCVAIHGQGFCKRAVFENLAAAYPHATKGCFNIGMLHTCATGRDGHDSYAPCTVDELVSKGYDYWALGHVHERETLHLEPTIVFPGNLQGRNIRETGPKGCMLVTVDDGQACDVAFHPLDVLRWQMCRVRADGAARVDDVLESFEGELKDLLHDSDDRPMALRVEISGRCPAHRQLAAQEHACKNQVRAIALDLGGGNVWIEKVKLSTAAPDNSADIAAAEGPLGELLGLINELRHDDGQLTALAKELDDLRKKLPGELLEGPDSVQLHDPNWIRGMLDQVEPLLIGRLLPGADVP